VLVKKIFV